MRAKLQSATKMTTMVYSYGAKPPSLREAECCEQIFLAHRYQNKLVEIERNRRERTATYMDTVLGPELLQRRDFLEEQIKIALESVKKARQDTAKLKIDSEARSAMKKEDAKKARQKSVRRVKMDPEAKAQIELWRAELKDVRLRIREKKTAIRAAEAEVNEGPIAIINAESKQAVRDARAVCGVFWGTYLLAERAHQLACGSIAPPKFHRFDGSGQIGVQLQGQCEGADRAGLPVSKLGSGDNRLQVLDMAQTEWRPKWDPVGRNCPGPNLESWRLLRIRIGSDKRDPIWAEVPFKLHRPLPENGIVIWATVQRRRCGTTFTWHVQFTLSIPGESSVHQDPNRTATIDVGWRVVPDGLRVATLSSGESLVLNDRILGQLEKPEKIRSGRDKDFDAIRISLQAWLTDKEPPTWLTVKDKRDETPLQNLGKWRSTAKLAKVVLQWRDNRTPGDEDIYQALEAWRKQDRHLLEMESHLRQRGQNARLDLYRNWALQVCKMYGVLVLEKIDLRELAKIPTVESPDDPMPLRVRHARTFATISELKLCLEEAAIKTGTELRYHLPRDTTQRCHLCGHLDRGGPLSAVSGQPMGKLASRVDPRPLEIRCPACGFSVDQDFRAAQNLLASADDPPKSLAALARE